LLSVGKVITFSILVLCSWSLSLKSWGVYDTASIRVRLAINAKDFTGEDMIGRMSAVNAVEFGIYLDELHLKEYSRNTIKLMQ